MQEDKAARLEAEVRFVISGLLYNGIIHIFYVQEERINRAMTGSKKRQTLNLSSMTKSSSKTNFKKSLWSHLSWQTCRAPHRFLINRAKRRLQCSPRPLSRNPLSLNLLRRLRLLCPPHHAPPQPQPHRHPPSRPLPPCELLLLLLWRLLLSHALLYQQHTRLHRLLPALK